MCGIAGIISPNYELVTRPRLAKMTGALAHRGPDGEKIWINPGSNAGFGHRRLSIIDLSEEAAQPMHYADRYTIIHNGEIYNYKELRHTLQQKGYSFRTQGDTEVIVAAYACYGTDCLQHFDGMFAFAIWDEQQQELFAARDRFGEKPFYYSFDYNGLIFASEMKALWPMEGVGKGSNAAMLYNYLTLGYLQNPHNAAETFFGGIHKLPARHYLTYRYKEHLLVRQLYWDIDLENHTKHHEQEVTREFHALFSQSVSRRLRSDVPLGVSLSGGLDSSSVLATMYEVNKTAYNTFSAVFPGFERDESEYIQLAAKSFNANNYTVSPSADEIINHIEKVCYHQEEPFQSASILAQYSVYELAKQNGVKVLLDGQGADEVLAGYFKYYHWYWQELFRADKKQLQHELNAARQLGIHEIWNWKNKLAALFPSYAAMHLRSQRKKSQHHHPDLTQDFLEYAATSYYEIPHVDKLNGVLYYNTFMNGLEELLRYADRNAMAHGVEVRLPFLNHELVQFIFSLPANYKIRDGRTKWLLRKAMENKVPAAILKRTDKIGFEPPQKKWMQDARLQEYTRESIRSLVDRKVLRASVLDKKIQPLDAHAAENYSWRYLLAGRLLIY